MSHGPSMANVCFPDVKRLTLGHASASLRHRWMCGGCGWMVTGMDADRW